jgi:hypothetical protein
MCTLILLIIFFKKKFILEKSLNILYHESKRNMLALVGKANKSFQFSTSSILLVEFSSKSHSVWTDRPYLG